MTSPIRLLVVAVAIALGQSTAFAAQTWTYQFTPTADTQPYYLSCGECSGIVSQNADVAGTFTLLLNWDTNTGKILELNDHLVNVIDEIYNGPGLATTFVPSNPATQDYGMLSPTMFAYPRFATSNVTFSNGLGHMKSDGRFRLSNGTYRIGIPYEIWFTTTAATLNLTVPIDDAFGTLTGATAAFQSSAWSGDLNHDGRVDKRDYLHLRKSTGADADYDAWRWSLGNVYFGAGTSIVPEPTSATILLGALIALLTTRRRPRTYR